MQLHEPGECPDSLYGKNCDGVGHLQIDPYAAELWEQYEMVWLCDGVAYGRAMDI